MIEREKVIADFTPETYFTLHVLLSADDTLFKAKLGQLQGQPRGGSEAAFNRARGSTPLSVPLNDGAFVKQLATTLKSTTYWVGQIVAEDVSRTPPAPFTTSTLQQAASSTLGFSPEQTMQLAQTLYETSLITYMRTDAVFIAPEAQAAAFDFIDKTYGEPYLPTEKPQYKSKPNAQEAHEAIRPTDVTLTPDHIKENVGDGAALYGLIWRRFVACIKRARMWKQMR